MKNISRKSCRVPRTYFMFNKFFPESCCLWDNVQKYCRARCAAGDNMAQKRCDLHAG